MSKIVYRDPLIHIPTFKEYQVDGGYILNKVTELGLKVPMGLLDWNYYYTDLEGWGKVLYDLAFNSDLYKNDRFDCENFALKAMNVCAERYGLNALVMTIGDMPLGRHGFNIFCYGTAGNIEGWKLWEPNGGFEWSGQPFDIGENNYFPDLVLL